MFVLKPCETNNLEDQGNMKFYVTKTDSEAVNWTNESGTNYVTGDCYS